jgi:RNA ligase
MEKLIELLCSEKQQKHYEGIIKIVQGPGDLYLLSYTDECQRRGLWDEVTLASRGLIIDKTSREVAALPFRKFFNWHEYTDEIPGGPFVVTEKIDGSLGVLYRHDGEYWLATRRSFDSIEAKRGTALLRSSLGQEKLPEEFTFLFEIVLSDAGSSIVKYETDGLYLLSIIDRHSSDELPHTELESWADRFGWKLPMAYKFSTLEEVHAASTSLPADFEGYVIRFPCGLRLKLKSETYLALLRASLGLSKKKVLNALSLGESNFQALLEQTPEELRPFAEKIAAEERARAAKVDDEVGEWFSKAPKDSRKVFALWIRRNAPEEYTDALFRMFSATGWR